LPVSHVYSLTNNTSTLHTKTEARIDDKRLLELQWGTRTAVEEEVGPGRNGSMPPAHGFRTKGGEGARRRCLRRSIDVGGHRARRQIAKTTTKTTTTTGGHRRRRRRQRSPGLVPTIGWEVVGHVRPDCELAGPALESADPAWRQLDLLRRNWEEKRSSGWRRRMAAAVAAARGARRGWRQFTMTYRPTISKARAHYTTIN
jgi:hypothetical protein